MRACVSVCYTNPQFSTDFDETWYEASLGARAEQGQVANALGQTAQQPCNPKNGSTRILAAAGPILTNIGMKHPWGQEQSKVRLPMHSVEPRSTEEPPKTEVPISRQPLD